VLATAPRVTKFPIDWGDRNNSESENNIDHNDKMEVEDAESNQIQAPPPQQSVPPTLGIGHDSNSLNLSEPIAS